MTTDQGNEYRGMERRVWDRAARIGQLERTEGAGQPWPESRERKTAGLPEHYRIGQLGQANRDGTTVAGHPGQVSWE
jgi:hypothetical protein